MDGLFAINDVTHFYVLSAEFAWHTTAATDPTDNVLVKVTQITYRQDGVTVVLQRVHRIKRPQVVEELPLGLAETITAKGLRIIGQLEGTFECHGVALDLNARHRIPNLRALAQVRKPIEFEADAAGRPQSSD